MSATFRTTRRFLGPRWLVSRGDSELVGYSLDLVKDAFADRVYQSLLVRFPEVAPDDALPLLGRDRRVTRGRNEARDTYVQRLLAWLDDRKTAGNPFSLMQKLAEYVGPSFGCSFRTVDVRGNWYSRAADGTRSFLVNQANWNWDNHADRWSRFWVIIYPGTLWERRDTWGDPGLVWGGVAGTWGSTATAEEAESVRAIVADWKPAGTRCVNVILAFDPASFDPASAGTNPAGLWGRWSKNVGGTQVAARLSTAIYWDGVNT
jgi:hypothetical protein